LTSSDATGNHTQSFMIDKQRFPFTFKGAKITIKKVSVFGFPKLEIDKPSLDKLSLSDPKNGLVNLKSGTIVGGLTPWSSVVDVEVKDLGLNKSEVEWSITVNKADIAACLEKLDDIFVLFDYIVEA
jgi:hypothetical protein